MQYSDFNALFDTIKGGGDPKPYALACAEERHTLEAAVKTFEDGFARPILIGERTKIDALLNELGKSDTAGLEIIDVSGGPQACAQKAIDLVNEGRANFIAKGLMDTSIILKAMLKKENNLTCGKLVSIVTFAQLSGYHKLICTSDVGLNMYPDLAQKKEILINAVQCCESVGIRNPKAAVLCSIENVNPKMPETTDAQALKQMNLNGEIPNCIVEGPISYDLAISKEAAVIKGYDSVVAGDADILLMPNITTGNVSMKALIRAGAAKVASVTFGLKVPLAFASRAAPIDEKYRAIMLAAAVSGLGKS